MTYSYVAKPLDGTIRQDVIRRDDDGAFVPNDPHNVDWVAYQAWCDAGNVPAAPSERPPVPPAAG